jgi:hypothetical protein
MMHAGGPDVSARLAVEGVVDGGDDGSIPGNELQYPTEHDSTDLVGRPACLAEEAVIATEGFNLQTVARSKNVCDRATAVGEQPPGHDHAEGLEG